MAETTVRRRGNRLLLSQWSDLLDEESFRYYWLMRLASHGASNALTYSLLVFTVRHSDSAIATGLLLLTMIVPTALFGAISGVAVDRLPRGLILFASNLARAALVVALVAGKESLPSLYAISLGLGMVSQFAGPAESAVLPQIVRAPRLLAANSVLQLGTLATQVLGLLILAPLLLKATDGDGLLFILAALFAVSAALITVIPQFHFSSTEGVGDVSLRSVRREFSEAWMRTCRDSTAFLSVILIVVTSTSTLIIATLLPKFSSTVLDVAPENIVFVLAPVGLAIFFGLRSVEFLADRLNKLVTISAAYVLMAAALIALGLVPGTAAALVSMDPFGLFGAGLLNDRAARIAATILYANIYGFSLTVVMTTGRVLLNERIPVEMQGRVFAAQAVLSNLVAIAPVVVAGAVADAVGVEPVLVCVGVVSLLAAAWSRARSSRIVPAEARPTLVDTPKSRTLD